MTVIYNLSIFLYGAVIRIAALFNTKARFFIQGRKGWEKKLKQNIQNDSNYIWFHCASLGEFEQGRPLIEEIRKQFPKYKVVLTFFSPSGYEIRKNYEGADVVCYLPLDTKQNARKFISLVKPQKVFFVKYEFWYHYITELKRNGIPLYMVSAIFRDSQHFFKNTPWGRWYRNIIFAVTHFFVQNQTSAALLQQIGIKQYTLSGDTRFDRVAAIANSAKRFEIVEKFIADNQVLIAGSTWKPDEELLAEFINNQSNNPAVKFIIAPHEVSASNINRIRELLKTPSILYSETPISDVGKFKVLIIDSIGILSSLYQYGNVAYIGGGFGVGIHNILEAATFGLPIVFGPNYKKFQEANDLVSKDGAFTINNYHQLEDTLTPLLTLYDSQKKAAGICKKYVEKNVGSTKLIINKVFNNQ
jgi:3-deoxy-D-manno-octulosonic-acid transferase